MSELVTASAVHGRDAAWRWLTVSIVVAAAIALLVLPLWALARTALEEGAATLMPAIASALPSVAGSLWTSLAASAAALTLGTTMAIVIERSTLPGRRALHVAMLLSLIVPGYVAAVGWIDAYAQGGLLDDLVGVAMPGLIGPLGIVVVLAAEATPIVYLVVSAGLATRADPDLERAARVSGADMMTTLRTVTLPLLRPVLAGAAAIAFVLSVTSFGVPAVLGVPAGFTTMTTRIYRDLAFSSEPESFVRAIGLAVVLAVGATALIALSDGLVGRASSPHLGRGSWAWERARQHARARHGRPAALAFVLAWGVVVLTVVVPLLGLAATALARAPGLAPIPANWSLDNFRAAVGGHTLEALGNSLLLAFMAAIVVIGLSGALLAVRRRRGTGRVSALLALTFALPGTTVAVAVLLAYGVALRDTLLIILAAYVAKFWALGYRPIAAGHEGLSPDLVRAARVCGADGWTTTRTIMLPLSSGPGLAGGLIVFLFGLHEVTMSSLLVGPGHGHARGRRPRPPAARRRRSQRCSRDRDDRSRGTRRPAVVATRGTLDRLRW